MSYDVHATPFGRPAFEMLHALVVAEKAADPLAPVSVLVPTNFVGVTARRLLASGQLGPVHGDHPGVAGVTFLTQYRLAELLGAPSLAAAGRRPISKPVVAAAIRRALADDPGVFGGVADHPATERALVEAYRELSELTSEQLELLEPQSPRASAVVSIHRRAREQLADRWYDERDLMLAARAKVEGGAPLGDDLGAVVLFLPTRVTAASTELLSAVASRRSVTVVAGLTGDAGADTSIRRVLTRFGADVPTLGLEPPIGHDVVSVADADDEVRHAVRAVIDAARDGVPLERMAILVAKESPYARLVHEQLSAAALPFNGSIGPQLDESLLGRSLLSLLALSDHDFRRVDVMSLLSSAPVRRQSGHLVPVSSWERMARKAGIVAGVDEWHHRLGRHRSDIELDRAGALTSEDRDWLVDRLDRELVTLDDLLTFLNDLVADLDPVRFGSSWADKCRTVGRLLRRYFGPPEWRNTWPKAEQDAAERVEAAVDRLAGLDVVQPEPSMAIFRRALDLELSTGLGRIGRFGDGIFVGRIGAALGLDLDRVFILGMAEGSFPSRRADDSLLPDRERAIVGDDLPLRSGRLDDDHRDLLAAFAAVGHRATLFFPRGDLRKSAENMPSRWLLDTIEAHNGLRPRSTDLHELRHHDWYHESPSFFGALRALDFPATEQEYDLRSLSVHREHGHDIARHALGDVPQFRNGLDLVRSRSGPSFSRFDGNLVGCDIPPVTDSDMSPTRLEQWPSCPHRYLFRVLLRVDVIEDPSRELTISHLDKGTLVHQVLDDFVSLCIATDNVPEPGQPWTRDHVALIDQLAEQQYEHYEQRGLTGKALFWQANRRELTADLHEFLERDNELRARYQSTPIASELGFGLPDSGTDAVPVELPDGRVLRFRGSADRVDRTADGGLLVIDYKTGSDAGYKGLDVTNPIAQGTKLQLPIYALAARAAFGRSDQPVHSLYWFTSGKRSFRTIGYAVTDAVLDEFRTTLGTITSGIEAGVFPHRPPAPSTRKLWVECPFCDPDGLGTRQRFGEWERMQDDAALSSFVDLINPELTLDV